jgi:hypothetical protein
LPATMAAALSMENGWWQVHQGNRGAYLFIICLFIY